MARRITREEGILAGRIVRHGSRRGPSTWSRDLMRGSRMALDKVVVVILPDGGRNYLSASSTTTSGCATTACWPRSAAAIRIAELLRQRHHGQEIPDVVVARTTDRVGAAIDLLQLYGISQLPVSERPEGTELDGIVGSVSEQGLLERTYREPGRRRADRRRGHGPAAADARGRRQRRRGVRAAVRRRRGAPCDPRTAARSASSRSSTCSSTSRTTRGRAESGRSLSSA